MGIVVRKSFVRLANMALTTREDMSAVGKFVIARIRARTTSGVDANGASFVPYSPAYAKAKTKAGGTSVVNLLASGRMLNAMTITDATDKSVTVSFSTGQER